MLSEIGIGAIVVAWFGSLELRIRNHVGKDRFSDLKDQTNRIETKIDTLLVDVATRTEPVRPND